MALVIKTTGLEDYLDLEGGSSNIKVMVVGGPDAGKTRMSSFWPDPIFADCEDGRGSLADRKVPYTEIKTSQDMLDFLAYLKDMERLPRSQRPYRTVVIDTLDSFQRKVKDEWLQATKSQTFKGFDAWGYLDSKVQMLMTRLLNLDMHVICLVHFKEKTGENDTKELMLQLQGDIANTAINDFALVGWLGTYWEAEGGERVEKRGLTFRKTPEKWFLKDRYGVLPRWVPITLTSDQDFTFIRDAFAARLDELTPGEVVGEVPTAGDNNSAESTAKVFTDVSGALPAQDPRDVPLVQFDKPTLVKMAREEGVTTTADGQTLTSNKLKSEFVAAIQAKRDADAAKAAEAPAPAETDAAPASPATPEATPSVAEENTAVPAEQVLAAVPQQRTEEPNLTPTTTVAPTPVPAASEQVTPVEPVADATPQADGPVVTTELGRVNTVTGEIEPPAVTTEQVAEALAAPVASETPAAETVPVPATPPAATPAQEQAIPSAGPTCEIDGCAKSLANENQDYVKLAFIKHRKRMCNEHYMATKRP